MEPSSSKPESAESTEHNSSSTASSNPIPKADSSIAVTASIGLTGALISGSTPISTATVASTISSTSTSSPPVTSSLTTSSITTASSSISTSSLETTPAIANASTTASVTSSSVTISIGVGAIQQQHQKISKQVPLVQTQNVNLTKKQEPSEGGIKCNLKDQLQVPKSGAPSSKPSSPTSVNAAAGEGPLGMKRPAPTSVESGGSSGTPSVGDPDSDTSAGGDPKKKKMKKEVVAKDIRSESPGVSTTTGNGSGRGGRSVSGKQVRASLSSSANSGKGYTPEIVKISIAASTSGTSSLGTSITTNSTLPTITNVSGSAGTTTVNESTASSCSGKSGQVAKASGTGNVEKQEESAKIKCTPSAELGGNGGPKVPPLKIVLQPHSSSTSSTSSTLTSSCSTGKSSKEKDDEILNPSTLSTGFPYIVSSTTPDNANSSPKEGTVSKSLSPLTTSSEEQKDQIKSGDSAASSSNYGTGTSKSSTSVALPANSLVTSTPEISSSQPNVDERKSSSPTRTLVLTASSSTSSSAVTAMGSSNVTSSLVSSSSTNTQQNVLSSSNSTSAIEKPIKEVTATPSNSSFDSKFTKAEDTTSSIASTVTSNFNTANISKEGTGKKDTKSGVSSSSSVEEKIEKEKESSKEKERETLTNSSGLKGPTRVTRSSHRIAAVSGVALGTPNSPSSVSPKTSACPSPSTSQHGDDQKQDAVEKMDTSDPVVDLHPRKRKLKTKEVATAPLVAATTSSSSALADINHTESVQNNPSTSSADPPPMMNCFEMYFNIRKQIARRRRNLFPVTPKPPKGFKDYLMNRGTYALQGNANARLSVPLLNPPQSLTQQMKDIFVNQEKSRHKLRLQHLVEKEKLVLSVEQEILRVHGRAARALSNQTLPFSVCTILKDEEVYSLLTPEQEEKDVTARSRYNGRLFLSWLQDVDDKWDKIKEQMLLRHHNEAESLHAVQKMDWEWKLKEVGLCEPKATPVIEEHHVPMVHVSDDFDLLPA